MDMPVRPPAKRSRLSASPRRASTGVSRLTFPRTPVIPRKHGHHGRRPTRMPLCNTLRARISVRHAQRPPLSSSPSSRAFLRTLRPVALRRAGGDPRAAAHLAVCDSRGLCANSAKSTAYLCALRWAGPVLSAARSRPAQPAVLGRPLHPVAVSPHHCRSAGHPP